MKTTIKKYLIVAFLFGTFISYAIENSNTINTVLVKKFKIEYKEVKKGHTLTIKDENKITLYKEEIKNSGDYYKQFDFTNLKDGLYTTELEKDFEIIIKKIKIDNGLVNYIEEDTTKIFKPYIRLKNDLLLISKISFKKEPIKVQLFYKDTMIHSEKFEGEAVLNRVYKLSKIEKGKYTVVLISDQRTYVKDFII
jgi:hypothetical protein